MPQIAQQDYIRINVDSRDFDKTLSGDALKAVINAVANNTIHDVIFGVLGSKGEVVGEAKVISVDFDNFAVYLMYGGVSHYLSYDV